MSDPLFKDASTCARSLSGRSHPLTMVKGLRGLPGLMRLAKSLPTLVVSFNEVHGPIAEHLQRGRRLPGARHLRICDSVLPVPETREKYLAGKPRARVRGNLNNARDLGI